MLYMQNLHLSHLDNGFLRWIHIVDQFNVRWIVVPVQSFDFDGYQK